MGTKLEALLCCLTSSPAEGSYRSSGQANSREEFTRCPEIPTMAAASAKPQEPRRAARHTQSPNPHCSRRACWGRMRSSDMTRTTAHTVPIQEAEEDGDSPHVACAALLVPEHPHGTLHTAPQQSGGVQDLCLPRETARHLLLPCPGWVKATLPTQEGGLMSTCPKHQWPVSMMKLTY